MRRKEKEHKDEEEDGGLEPTLSAPTVDHQSKSKNIQSVIPPDAFVPLSWRRPCPLAPV